jgi:cytoskeletal protein CcmA (bactofilin family)
MFSKKNGLDKEMQKAENETISSVIDKSMSVSGEMSFKGKTRIDGTINGNVNGEHLILSESGKIVGDIKVSSFICHGYLEGNIISKLVTARKGCSIIGKLEAGSLTVEPGATLDGEVRAAAGKDQAAAPETSDKQAAAVSKKNDK